VPQNTFDATEVLEFETATWTRCADTYEDGFGALVTGAIDPLLDALEVGPGTRLLDIGTGPGLLAAAARQRGAEVTGLDASEAMIRVARRRHPGISFDVGTAESLPHDDDAFDTVAGNFVLHHSGAPDRVLAEAARATRPGGRVGFTVWGALDQLVAFGLFFAAVEEHLGAAELPHGPLFGVSDAATFRGMLAAAGLVGVSVRDIPIAWRTESLDPYLTSFEAWANLGAIDPAVRDRIRATVRSAANGYRDGDHYRLPNPGLLISAQKAGRES